jgi:xanthine dehydrogenase accessory factor
MASKDILDVLVEMRDADQPFALATVVETAGSVSAKTGSKAVIDQDGRVVVGWVGGGCAESTVCSAALECMRTARPRIVDIDLNDEVLGVGMPCGGNMRVYVEPMLPRPGLWIMGHGEIAEQLCELGGLMGFKVIVNDALATAERFPAADRLITDDTLDYRELQPGPSDFVVIATLHKGDHHSIQRALQSQTAYIAMIASRKRAGLVIDYLQQEKLAPEQIERVRTPAGLDLGARTPAEIALCVISEIVMIRRGGSGRAMHELLDVAQPKKQALA